MIIDMWNLTYECTPTSLARYTC